MEENKTKNLEVKESDGAEKKKFAQGKKGINIFILLLLIIILGLAVWFGRGMLGSPNVALVNDQGITKAEYNSKVAQIIAQYKSQLAANGDTTSIKDEEIEAQAKNAALDELINEELFLQAAARAKISISDEEVESEIARQKAGYTDEAAFHADLKALGMTEKDLRENIRKQLTIIAYAKSVLPKDNYTVTDDEMKEIYSMNFGKAEGGDSGTVPTYEEFVSANRSQFELQKLSMTIGPVVKDLRSKATIKILVDLPKKEANGTPTTANGQEPVKSDGTAKAENPTESNSVESTTPTTTK